MGEAVEAPKGRIIVYLTGYGPFGTVKVNPSAAVASRVAERLKQFNAAIEVRYTELDVSIKMATAYFEKVEKEIKAIIEERRDDAVKILLCHLGVHPDTTGVLRLEIKGVNELFATLSDVDGVALNHDPIVAEDGPIETTLTSWFGREGSPQRKDLDNLVQQLSDAAAKRYAQPSPGLPKNPLKRSVDRNTLEMAMPVFQQPRWVISSDAGRYLCNCALYRALRLQEQHAGMVFAIFVHVPNPTSGMVEVEGGPIVAYNPTVVVQSEQVLALVRSLLDMVM